MTPDDLEAIRERDRGFWLGLSASGGTGTQSQIDRRTLLDEVSRLNAEIDGWRVAFNDLSARYLANGWEPG